MGRNFRSSSGLTLVKEESEPSREREPKEELYMHLSLGFPGGSVVKNLPASAGDVGSILGLVRSPREGNGNLLQYSCLGKSHGQRSLAGCSPWNCKRVGHDLATKQ